MKKFAILFTLIMFTCQTAISAEKIPVKITPVEIISTHHDEVEVGDNIKFRVINDVYYQNKIYIKKDSTVLGTISNVHENGYFCDNAEIIITPFKLRTTDNKVITINSTIIINRKDFVCKNFGDRIVKYFGVIFRGNEIKIEPNSIDYNLFLVK